jgi:hypothetical protein
MVKFKTKIERSDSDKEFSFECYENTEPIEIGDKFLFIFGGIADVQICDSEHMKLEINKHDRPYKEDRIDLIYNFWRNCYKIKSTDFGFNTIQ